MRENGKSDQSGLADDASGRLNPRMKNGEPIRLSRRVLLGAMLAGGANMATGAIAGITQSPIPQPRPQGFHKRAATTARDILKKADLGGQFSAAVANASTGDIVESTNPLRAMPPASVTKAITALYALDALGENYRFATVLRAAGPIIDGRLSGDLILQGGGDPTLDTDALASLAVALKSAGVREVTGALRIDTSALPNMHEIDPTQKTYASYNPAISALNLNYNRVHFEWRREGANYTTTMQARTDHQRPAVRIAKIRIEARNTPLFTYASDAGIDHWSVARAALGKGGSRWLPVRKPAQYTAEVFSTMARAQGIKLGSGAALTADPAIPSTEITRIESAPLRDILKDMLKYSTNLTAEVTGLAATAARGVMATDLASSAAEMNIWIQEQLGTRHAYFVDHSGLGQDSRISSSDMTRLLGHPQALAVLRPILKPIALRDSQGKVQKEAKIAVFAKTGTLDFVSALAGYVTTQDDTLLAFAIFNGDLDRRAQAHERGEEIPQGARAWNKRAKTLQQDLIERWALVHSLD
jgi:D-alanyl-D-alanine carboxypeptidase/D-alanyl-D-alanine-endopeptidase (penicillin-binding protein 4)